MPDPGRHLPGVAILLLPLVMIAAYVVAEIALLIFLAQHLGWWTLGLLIATTLLGVALLQFEWRKAWPRLADSLRTGSFPPGRASDAALVLLGGIMLILPGFISDVAGLLLLLPPTRPLVRACSSWLIGRMGTTGATSRRRPTSGYPDGDVVEGEVVDMDDSGGTTSREIKPELPEDDR